VLWSLAEEWYPGGIEIGADAVWPDGMAPPAGRISGDVDGHFHDDVGLHQVHIEGALCPPPRAERPPVPGVRGRGWGEQLGEGAAGSLGQGGAAAGALQAPGAVVAAQQNRAGRGQRAGTAPTMASVVTLILYFLHERTGRYGSSSLLKHRPSSPAAVH
jgi:hypothetical protein